MSEVHDNVSSSKEVDLERTSSTHQKIHYNRNQRKFIKNFPDLINEATTLGPICSCNLERDVLWEGNIYPTDYHICFYGKIFANKAKVTIHYKDITQIEKRSTVGMFPNAIRINTVNTEYVFSSFLKRDVMYQLFLNSWHKVKSNNESNTRGNENNQNNQSLSEFADREINGHKKSNSVDQIDAGTSSNEELKNNLHHNDDTNTFSHSYPDQFPIENISNNDDVNESLSPNEGYQNKMLENSYNLSSKNLYQLLFEDNSKFLYDVYKDSNNENIKIGLWKKDARTNLRERVIMYNSLNKSLFASRGNILTEEKQKFLKNDKDNFFIESEIRILNINYSDYFKIVCKYFITSDKEDYSNLLITFEVKYTKKFALSEKVEKIMFENYNRLFTELENHLNRIIKKVNNEYKGMDSEDNINTITEPILGSIERLTNDYDEGSYETLNDKKEKTGFSTSQTEKEIDDSDKINIFDQLFNNIMVKTTIINYLLDGVFLIISIIFHIPKIIISATNHLFSQFKQDQKHGKKRSSKDEKKILSNSPYLIVVLELFSIVGIFITISNAYYSHQLRDVEKLIRNKQPYKINPSLLSKLSDDLSKSGENNDIIESLLGTTYSRYNDIYEKYNKQKDKHSEDFNISYLRLKTQLELMNNKFDIMKSDIENIEQSFSNEGLINLIKEMEQNEQNEKLLQQNIKKVD
ncbi:hypothetical protein BCR32DRAFT_277901 [Anaeromyces robustus]|uniref:VASt domain-containing protein n=1 Tax=Anaeromyces robustus TaxID=1754192 RepID=A0A1Y1XCW5_9FUNG|nr:hypothetical protein BCR32DRAFT_277901 [Anaeromyces robustus]|eukprot:ORX83578.1 hypothetical protein BCR32DRAFT_277901 [Anaeromyces robustus]